MHPELSKRLVLAQLAEALQEKELFCDRVQLEEIAYPSFFIRFINRHGSVRLIRFECTNYDFQAIGIEPVNTITREPLSPNEWMLRNGGAFPSHYMKGGRPFLCVQGTRDFYTHEGHRPNTSVDRWEKWRNEFRIPDLVKFIKNKIVSGEWE